MARMGTYLENILLNLTLQAVSFSPPGTIYAGLNTADPTDTTATALGNEVTGSGYVREAITFGAASGGISATTVDLVWPAATGSWGTIGFITVWDIATLGSGNLMYHGLLTPTVTISTTDQLKILAGNLTIQFT